MGSGSTERTGDRVDLAGRIAFRVSLVVAGVVATIWLAVQLASILLLVFVAAILAAGVFGPARWIERRGVPRVLAVVGVYAAVIAGLVVVVVLVLPPVLEQLFQLVTQLPSVAQGLLDRLQSLTGMQAGDNLVQRAADAALGQLQGATDLVSGVPFAVAGIVTSTVSAIFLSVLILLERENARRWIFRFVNDDDRETLGGLADSAADKLGAFVRGQLLIMTVTGVASGVGLWIIGVPFPVALGLLAFLTEAIPLAGPIIAGAVMVAVALIESPGQALAVIALVIAVQQLEGLVLVPQIQGRVISISPAVALVAVLAGSTLGGIVGALVAIPAVALATVLIDEVILPWRRREIRGAREGEEGAADAGERSASSGS